YVMTGIGLQARRHKKLNFWGLVIIDNRRKGEDFFLYEVATNAGDRQQIPLSSIQLETRIASVGHVVQPQGHYLKFVSKYIFGFESMEAYGDLIELLIQLRSPKLSKDFRPTVIYDILEAALPPLTDEDLRHLSDTIEHMDQTKQQIEQLEREQQAMDKLLRRYHTYNEARLVESAHYCRKAQKRLTAKKQAVHEKTAAENALQQEIARLNAQSRELDQTKSVLEQKRDRLHSHNVWNLEKERANEEAALQE